MHNSWLRGAGDICGELFTYVILKMTIKGNSKLKVDVLFGTLLVQIGPETTVGEGLLHFF